MSDGDVFFKFDTIINIFGVNIAISISVKHVLLCNFFKI